MSQGLDPTEMDQFARLLVNIFSQYNRTLPLIRELIEGEFKLVTEANKGAILRGNSMTSKIESAYSRILNQMVSHILHVNDNTPPWYSTVKFPRLYPSEQSKVIFLYSLIQLSFLTQVKSVWDI